MAEILIVRHSQPELRGVFLGSLDPGLSEKGLEQAQELKVAAGLPVFVSPMRRAIETAKAAGMRYEVVEGLREIDYGPWEGLSWKEIEVRFPEEARLKMENWLGYMVPGAEDWVSFRSRVLASFELLRRPCVVVAHLAVNSVIREAVTKESPLGFMQGYCEIVKLEP